MSKMRFTSWAAAEEAERHQSGQAAILHEALRDVLVNHPKWIKSGRYAAAIIHPESAHGGIVIVKQSRPKSEGYSSVYYAETWANDVLRLTYSGQEGYELAHLATLVKRELDLVNERLRAEAGLAPTGQEVK